MGVARKSVENQENMAPSMTLYQSQRHRLFEACDQFSSSCAGIFCNNRGGVVCWAFEQDMPQGLTVKRRRKLNENFVNCLKGKRSWHANVLEWTSYKLEIVTHPFFRRELQQEDE